MRYYFVIYTPSGKADKSEVFEFNKSFTIKAAFDAIQMKIDNQHSSCLIKEFRVYEF